MIGNQFEYASPESLGIPSAAVAAFLREMEECRFPLHSYILMRHGKIAAEGYVAPFTADRKHRMYSVSKSFTSVAVGMLITEGRLSLDDRVADFFPEYLPDHPSPYTLRATVRDLLRMATPNEDNSYKWGDTDFVATFFNNPKDKHEPGTIFHYDTAGTTTLCGLVEKITGMPILDYMRPLLDALGISGDIWCIQTPEGRSWTGSGIMCTSRDLLRFGLFCLQKGQWNGRQWVDRQYMEEATSKQIDINTAHSGYVKDGYGYQFWMVREGGFACSGMGGQYAFMMPKEDVVMVTTADTQGIDNAEDATKRAFYRLLDSMTEKPLPEDEAGERLLREAVPKTLPGPVAKPSIPWRSGIPASPIASIPICSASCGCGRILTARRAPSPMKRAAACIKFPWAWADGRNSPSRTPTPGKTSPCWTATISAWAWRPGQAKARCWARCFPWTIIWA